MIKIEITYDSCVTDMKRAVEYEGHKNGIYDKLRPIVNDHDQLLIYWQNGITELNNILDRVIAKVETETDGEDCDYDLDAGLHDMNPAVEETAIFLIKNDNDGIRPMLLRTMQRLVVARMMMLWLRVVSPEILSKYQGEETMCQEQLARLAYYREMP